MQYSATLSLPEYHGTAFSDHQKSLKQNNLFVLLFLSNKYGVM